MNTQRETMFITGAAARIGLVAARHFYKLGYVMDMADLNLSMLEEVTAQWDDSNILLYSLDVSDSACII
jgi:NADP-dependent 3-hydroxy acid dehydrogenase YdfG